MTDSASRSVPRSWTWAARFLTAFAVVVAANWLVTALRGAATGPMDLAFSVLLLIAAGGIGRGLTRGATWSRPAAAGVAVVGLFFIAPVLGTILLGGGTEPVGTGWDVIYFPLMTALLVAVVVLLARDDRAGKGPTGGAG